MPRHPDPVRRSWTSAGALVVAAGTLATAVAPTDTAFADIARAFGVSVVAQLWFAGLAIASAAGVAVMHGRGDARIVELASAISSVTYLMATARLIAGVWQDDRHSPMAASMLLALAFTITSFLVAALAHGIERTASWRGRRGRDGTQRGADGWDDAALEDAEGWRDQDGRSPVDVWRAYLDRRHAWEARMARRDPRPGTRAWDELGREFRAIYSDLCTPQPIETRDSSVATPRSRDRKVIRLVDVVREAADRVVVHTFEPDPGGFEEEEYRYLVVHTAVGWRLDDRLARVGDDWMGELL